MAFGEDLRLFADKVEGRARDVFTGTVDRVHASVVDGSPETAAPGQPVDTGNLKASWIKSRPADWIGEVATNVVYAPAIEEGQQAPYTNKYGTYVEPRPITLPYPGGGGPHSVMLTRTNWDRIVESTLREVVG